MEHRDITIKIVKETDTHVHFQVRNTHRNQNLTPTGHTYYASNGIVRNTHRKKLIPGLATKPNMWMASNNITLVSHLHPEYRHYSTSPRLFLQGSVASKDDVVLEVSKEIL